VVDTQTGSEKDESFEVDSVGILDNSDKALLEYGKNVLINSVDIIKNFAQSMITLVSGLFAVYFALIEFLGITSLQTDQAAMIKDVIVLPPIFFIISLIVFVLAVLPLPGRVSLNILSDIKRDRRLTLLTKYIAVILGMAFLVAALSISIIVFLRF
jgi:hypothetical protein